MKILIITSHLRRGGPTDVIYNICSELVEENGIDLFLLSLRKEPVDNRTVMFKNLGVKVLELNRDYLQCELLTHRVTQAIQRIVDDLHIDIVHSNVYHPALACKGLLNVKKISTLHNRAAEDFINVFGNIIGKYMLKRYFNSLRTFDCNVAVSKSTADVYAGVLPHVTFVNNGIDVTRFSLLDEAKKQYWKKRLKLPSNRLLIISTGRIEREKGYEEMVSWFNHVGAETPFTLIIVGDGSRLRVCKELAKKNSQIIFTGKIGNVQDYLKCADFYISNSQSEGMSMAVCEGISCGLFPILSDIPSHHDVGDDIGALFFKDLNDINLNLLRQLSINRLHLHDYIRNHFSVQTMSEGYLHLYHQLMSC